MHLWAFFCKPLKIDARDLINRKEPVGKRQEL